MPLPLPHRIAATWNKGPDPTLAWLQPCLLFLCPRVMAGAGEEPGEEDPEGGAGGEAEKMGRRWGTGRRSSPKLERTPLPFLRTWPALWQTAGRPGKA